MYLTGDDGLQNMFVYQPAFSKLQMKKDKGINDFLIRKSKRLYRSILSPRNPAFLHNIKLSGYRIGIKFEKDPLVVEQNNYATETV